MVAGSKVSAVSRLRDAGEAKRQPLWMTVLCVMLVVVDVVSKRERNFRQRGKWGG